MKRITVGRKKNCQTVNITTYVERELQLFGVGWWGGGVLVTIRKFRGGGRQEGLKGSEHLGSGAYAKYITHSLNDSSPGLQI